MKNTITEIKNILEGIHSRLDDTEEWISELTVVETIQAEQKNLNKGLLKRLLGQFQEY